MRQCACAGRRDERGFSVVQLIITLSVISIVLAFALVNVARARGHMRLTRSARIFAGYVEKARLDAIRRHGGGAQPATVQFIDNSRYTVTMDFNGTNTPTTRTVSFDAGVTVQSLPPQPLTFDWRGRLALCTQTFLLKYGSDDTSTSVIDISGSGDVTVDGDAGDMPAITHSLVTGGDTLSESVVQGTAAPPAATIGDCSGAGGSPPPPVGNSGCGTSNVGPSLVTVRKNGATSATVTVQVGTATTVTATAASNITVTPTSKFIASSGTFTVASNNNWRSTFPVTFNAPCFTSPITVQVKVVN